MLLNEVHLPLLIQSVLSEHSKVLVWKNLEQLSFMWAVFTKCKKDIKDGFRLENLSWRLWYRQSILRKKTASNERQIEFNSLPSTPARLKKSHSLPNLSQYKENIDVTIPTQLQRRQDHKAKFYLSDDEEIQQQLTFPKKNLMCALTKPVSLLSDMLQLTTETSGLRRCNSRYCRLDQFFINAT